MQIKTIVHTNDTVRHGEVHTDGYYYGNISFLEKDAVVLSTGEGSSKTYGSLYIPLFDDVGYILKLSYPQYYIHSTTVDIPLIPITENEYDSEHLIKQCKRVIYGYIPQFTERTLVGYSHDGTLRNKLINDKNRLTMSVRVGKHLIKLIKQGMKVDAYENAKLIFTLNLDIDFYTDAYFKYQCIIKVRDLSKQLDNTFNMKLIDELTEATKLLKKATKLLNLRFNYSN